VSNSRYRLPVVSSTFHGRDIFAPVAAWISRGIPLEEIGVELKPDEIVRIEIENKSRLGKQGCRRLNTIY